MRRAAIILALICGCGSEPPAIDLNNQTQVCERCGAEWTISSKEKVPPTIEWCFHDGNYCLHGLILLTDKSDIPDSEKERRWLNHCLKCEGCRMAAFEPEEWKEIVRNIEAIRNNDEDLSGLWDTDNNEGAKYIK